MGWGVGGHGESAGLEPKNYGELPLVFHWRMTQTHLCIVSVPLAADRGSPRPSSQAGLQRACSVCLLKRKTTTEVTLAPDMASPLPGFCQAQALHRHLPVPAHITPTRPCPAALPAPHSLPCSPASFGMVVPLQSSKKPSQAPCCGLTDLTKE